VQRLFATFPTGSPGLGLLVLRLAVALALVVHGAACLAGEPTLGMSAVAVTAALTAALLVIGLLTPLAGSLAAVTGVGLAMAWLPAPTANPFEVRLTAVLVVSVATAIALLGPGAFSLDAALFGRREIAIPPTLEPGTR
jgi:uncharacterized membrane protein YphA (DoxX/SURF4 family)